MPYENYKDLVHTGPSTPAGRFMRTFWQPISLAKDLKAGRAKPIRIMSEDFTVYRGESGKPHVVDFRCAHRQTQLSAGWVEEDCIRCFYHGWKYNGSGQCVEIPGEEASHASNVKIKSYPTEEYLGLIFAYFGEGEPQQLPHYPECEGPGILETFSNGGWPCNYFTQLDNAGDPIHVGFTHREARRRVKMEAPMRKMIPEETMYGIKYTSISPDGKKFVRHFFMPNILQLSNSLRHDGIFLDDSVSGGAVMPRLIWNVPIDDASFESFIVTYVPLTDEKAEKYKTLRQKAEKYEGPSIAELGNAVLAGKLRIPDIQIPDTFYGLIQVEDYVAQVGQGPQDHTINRLCRNDIAIVLLRKIWERELRSLVEHRPRKKWQRSESFNMMAQE